MRKQVIIMNFTGVYENEAFSRNPNFKWLDCRHLQGTNCYCDAEGASALQQVIAGYAPEGIHFIDSGNYHYITKFWTDKIDYPFSLIVFDHHPDMQPPLFEELLSCGSWVKDIIDHHPKLQKVVIAGASERLIHAVPESYKEKVHFYGEQTLKHDDAWKLFTAEHINEPIYISIDKDVLNPQSAVTNWDQGSLSLKELEELLTIILKNEKVIGIDICGECTTSLNMLHGTQEAGIDSHANEELLRLIARF